MGEAIGRGHWERAVREARGNPELHNSQVKKGLDKESVSAESKAAES